MQGLHFALLVGLLLGLRWELVGGGVTLAAALAFFGNMPGPNTPLFLLATCGPAALWLVLGGFEMGRRSGQPPS